MDEQMTSSPNITLLLDADGIAWLDSVHDGSGEQALRQIDSLIEKLQADRVIACFSDYERNYWKRSIWPQYKSQSNDRPASFQQTCDAIRGHFPSREIEGLEADDLIGILATCRHLKGHRIIVSADQDLRGVPGDHYDFRKKERFSVTVEEADRFHLMQTLTGKSKSYPGCPGIGPIGAEKILNFAPESDRAREAWCRVLLAFQRKGQDGSAALVQAQVARICRAEDFDFESKKVTPWMPPHERITFQGGGYARK